MMHKSGARRPLNRIKKHYIRKHKIEYQEINGKNYRAILTLCRAFAPNSAADGLEVVFKGGQAGGEDYFEMVGRGKSY